MLAGVETQQAHVWWVQHLTVVQDLLAESGVRETVGGLEKVAAGLC